jgi:hypothetical protein
MLVQRLTRYAQTGAGEGCSSSAPTTHYNVCIIALFGQMPGGVGRAFAVATAAVMLAVW